MYEDSNANEVMEVFIKQQEERIAEMSRQMVIMSTKNKMLEDKNKELEEKLKTVIQELKKISNTELGKAYYATRPDKKVKNSVLSSILKQENTVQGGFVHKKNKKR